VWLSGELLLYMCATLGSILSTAKNKKATPLFKLSGSWGALIVQSLQHESLPLKVSSCPQMEQPPSWWWDRMGA
jgi:hypothetical protein